MRRAPRFALLLGAFLVVGLLALLALHRKLDDGTGRGGGGERASRGSERTVELPAGGSRSVALAPGTTDSFPIRMAAGQAARLEVDQRGVDVVLSVRDPRGDVRQGMDRLIGAWGREWVSVVADEEGTYRVEVAAGGKSGGRYQVHLEGPRAAMEADRRALAAEEAFIAGRRWAARARGASGTAAKADLQRAAAAFRKAAEEWRRAGEQRGRGIALAGLGDALFDLEQGAAADRAYRAALPLLEAGGEAGRRAEILSGLGVLHRRRGELGQALAAYQESLALAHDSHNRAAEANALDNIATAYRFLHRVPEALRLYSELVRIYEERGEDLRKASVLYKIGQVYIDLGDGETARSYLAEALEIVEAKGGAKSQAFVLGRIGRVYLLLEEGATARRYLERALVLEKREGLDYERAATLNDLGRAYRRLGNLERSVDAYERALALYREMGADRDVPTVEMNLAWVYDAQGHPREALDRYREAAAAFAALGDTTAQASVLYGRARALAHEGRLAEAQGAIEEALRRVESRRGELANPKLGELWGATKESYFRFYVDLLLTRAAADPGAGYAARALEASDRGRAWGLLDRFDEARRGIRQGVDADLVARRDALWEEIAARRWESASRRPTRGVGGRGGALDAGVRDLLTQLDVVESKIRAASPGYAALTRPRTPPLKEIQRRLLDRDTLLVVYSLGEERSFAFLVSRDRFEVQRLASRSVIESAARTARRRLLASRRRTARRPTAEALEALAGEVLAPLGRRLAARRLVLVLDGALHYVPFAALPSPLPGEDGAPLVAHHEIVRLPSIAALAELRRMTAGRKRPPGTVAVFADPVFRSDDQRVKKAAAGAPASAAAGGAAAAVPGEDLRRLAYSRQEAKAILSLVPAEKRFAALDFDASLGTLKRVPLDHYRILHFATHAHLDEVHPLLTSLVLSLVDRRGRPRDGHLFLGGVYNLHLPIDLVVLSACDTALGRAVEGEGLLGLTRGFMYAGAPRVLVSLWTVDDRATADLMKRFYRALLVDHLPAAAALAAAQDSERRKTPWKSPFYWAGFVLEGDWR